MQYLLLQTVLKIFYSKKSLSAPSFRLVGHNILFFAGYMVNFALKNVALVCDSNETKLQGTFFQASCILACVTAEPLVVNISIALYRRFRVRRLRVY